MSVLVKGMEMPKNCTRCDYIGLNAVIGCSVMSGTNGRATDCPLVALPDHHGRLVDAEADSLKNKLKLINEAEHQIYGRGSWGFTAKCIHAIDDAATVIEAEDGE